MNKLQIALDHVGQSVIAGACGVSRQAVNRWYLWGALPDTEWLDATHPRRTNYAETIAKIVGCKRKDLL